MNSSYQARKLAKIRKIAEANKKTSKTISREQQEAAVDEEFDSVTEQGYKAEQQSGASRLAPNPLIAAIAAMTGTPDQTEVVLGLRDLREYLANLERLLSEAHSEVRSALLALERAA